MTDRPLPLSPLAAAATLSEQERLLRAQFADLARHAPDLFSAAVRYLDALGSSGLDHVAARERALEAARDEWRRRNQR